MKIRIDIDENLEEEIIIRCNKLSEEVQKIQGAITEALNEKHRIVFYKEDVEYYLQLETILFFETDAEGISAHTIDDIYTIKYRLYELEELLPGYFLRVSKSSILNTKRVYAIEKNLSASSVVQFQHTHKQVYVSRRYYKPLKDRMAEKRG